MAEKQDNGFVKISRNILEWEWYQDVVTRSIFLHCILKANWKEKTWKGQKIKRGQFVTSLAALAKETGFSIRQTRTALDHLQLTGEVTNLSTPQYRIITVNNYDKYQSATKQPTNNRQSNDKASGKRPTTTKERKKKRKKAALPQFPLRGRKDAWKGRMKTDSVYTRCRQWDMNFRKLICSGWLKSWAPIPNGKGMSCFSSGVPIAMGMATTERPSPST